MYWKIDLKLTIDILFFIIKSKKCHVTFKLLLSLQKNFIFWNFADDLKMASDSCPRVQKNSMNIEYFTKPKDKHRSCQIKTITAKKEYFIKH